MKPNKNKIQLGLRFNTENVLINLLTISILLIVLLAIQIYIAKI